jgi:hypothetical protein
VRHHGEAEPSAHARGVVAQLQVLEVAQLGELDDGPVAPARLSRGETHHHGVHDHVLVGREFVVEPHAQLDDRRNSPRGQRAPLVGLVDPGEDLQERALAAGVAPGDAEELAPTHIERDAGQHRELPIGRPRPVHEALAQGGHLAGRDPEGLREVPDLDGV